MTESPMRRRLRYQRRFTELVREDVKTRGVDPKAAAQKAVEKLAGEWRSEFPNDPVPGWEPFQGATN